MGKKKGPGNEYDQACRYVMHAGKLPASPNPKANRAMLKPTTVPTSAWPMAARLQSRTESEKPLRVPSQSIARPAINRPIA